MGRKSLAVQRREDILNAFEQCILERGIEGTSFQHIAQVLGMDRKMISHYFGNREALVDAMIQRINDDFNLNMSQVLANLKQSASVLELVDAFFDRNISTEEIEVLWAEISAYATRSEAVRNRLRQSYDKMFEAVGKALKRDYPNAPKKQLQTATYAVATLLDRSPTFEWIGVRGSPLKSAKTAIEQVLESLE
ncbi:TetR/AcrR family transcriptional regulator [Acaryochloris marina NIES-2412]|uniref:TetR/AcrR family transcriptional regulator n=1 Tax=Acaryochloris marina TaxID=155978 RepID=UPI004059D6E4